MAYNRELAKPSATVVIPTLHAGPMLRQCLESLERQTRRDFETIVVDNSGTGKVLREGVPAWVRVLEQPSNTGFGAALNRATAASDAAFVAALNDDAQACPRWLDALLAALQSDSRLGMAASRVLLAGRGVIDSAGMQICADGSSRQRGHGEPPERFEQRQEVLFASGSAALYRRAMLDDTGGFDESFFLYCEDTDLGLRAVRAGWRCLYVPEAIVEHAYSQSAGRFSRLKAYHVERNRLYVVIKNFPASLLWKVPFLALERYWWHAWLLRSGKGSAAQFRQEGGAAWLMAWIVVRAHAAALWRLGRLWRQRRRIFEQARVSPRAFRDLLAAHSLSPRQVAEL